DGKALAQTMQAEIAARVADFAQKKGLRPGLAAVLVGDNPARQLYVRNKRQACDQARIENRLHPLPPETPPDQPIHPTAPLIAAPKARGILVQLPLPKQINESAIIDAVAPIKDVDGFGPTSLGLLTAGTPRFLPCTPAGVQQILLRNQIKIAGQHVVIVGRSN